MCRAGSGVAMNARHERAGHSNGQGFDGERSDGRIGEGHPVDRPVAGERFGDDRFGEDRRPVAGPAGRAARFGRLPERVRPEQMVEESPSEAPNDPQFGRDPDTDWLIRYCA